MTEKTCWVVRINTADLHYQATIGPFAVEPKLDVYRAKYRACTCCDDPLIVVAAEGLEVSNQFYRTVV
jgi:hypothetical protein